MDIGKVYEVGTGRRKTLVSLMPLTVEMAKSLEYGDTVYLRVYSGDIIRTRVYSKIKTWKRDPSRVEFSVKYGLYDVIRVNERHIVRGDVFVESDQLTLF
ncbi:MAG: hypothetical protein QXT45_06205 [Candidatus Bilamarchaeaceae archaeon]